jgi:RNA polymerase sigma-70 factor (ECF subfamily)
VKEAISMTDEGIVNLYWDRNEAAITETDLKYGRYCFSISYNILSNKEDSDECVNDTYNAAWNSMPPQRPVILSAFLGKIVRNISLNRYKEITAQKRGGNQMELILDELGEIVSDMPGPDDRVIQTQLVKAINEFLAGLPAEKRIMFVRRYWYADDIGAIAKRMGMSANNVSVEIRRIRLKLRGYLIERGFDV